MAAKVIQNETVSPGLTPLTLELIHKKSKR